MNRRSAIVGFGFFAVALAVPQAAHARRFRFPRGAGGRAGSKSYTGSTLTQSQLEKCLVDGRQLDADEATIAAYEREINEMAADLEAMQRRLESDALTLDRYDGAEVDAYNANVDHYEVLRAHFNSGVDEFNGSVSRFNASAGSYNTSCNGKTYYEDDMEAARAAVGVFD